ELLERRDGQFASRRGLDAHGRGGRALDGGDTGDVGDDGRRADLPAVGAGPRRARGRGDDEIHSAGGDEADRVDLLLAAGAVVAGDGRGVDAVAFEDQAGALGGVDGEA